MRKDEESKKGRSWGLIMNAVIGSFIALIISILLLLIFSVIIASGKIPDDLMSIITIVVFLLGSLIGSFVAVKRHKRQALIIGIAEGATLFFITLICGAFTDAESLIGEISLPLLVMALLGGAIGAIISSRPKKRKL